jgi:hypothetical protein
VLWRTPLSARRFGESRVCSQPDAVSQIGDSAGGREFRVRILTGGSRLGHDGEIFYNNCFQNGVLPVVLVRSSIEEIVSELEQDAGRRLVTVDLERQRVVSPRGREYAFEIPGLRREALLEGLDDLGLTLKREAVIAAHQERDRKLRPWIYETVEVQS